MLEVYSRLGIALGLGLLVGLQRQRTDARLAGFRTFPLIILFGALTGLLAEEHGGWIVAAGLAALALVIVGGNFPLVRAVGERPGVTTEVAMLLVFALGAYVMVGSPAVAIATCGAVVVLLHLKPQMHSLAERIGDNDFRAIIQFALISLVILPVLPNRTYGPYDVLNPFKIWLMVALIVGISLGGYVAYKLVGVKAGAWMSAVLGGTGAGCGECIRSADSFLCFIAAGRPTFGRNGSPVISICRATTWGNGHRHGVDRLGRTAF